MQKITIPQPKYVLAAEHQGGTGGSQVSTMGSTTSEEDVAVLAYHLWEQRGCPEGSAEMDWFEAEEQLRSMMSQSSRSATAGS
jgi:Protein of unknown function (DUF2934)